MIELVLLSIGLCAGFAVGSRLSAFRWQSKYARLRDAHCRALEAWAREAMEHNKFLLALASDELGSKRKGGARA